MKPKLEKTRESLKALANYYHVKGNKSLMYAANTCIGLIDNQINSDHFDYYYSFLERDQRSS